MASPRSIFEYDNYREFLKDYYSEAKAKNKKFSLGYFSKLAGFKSRSVLRQVIAGERNIAPHSIEKFSKALKLSRSQSSFFKNLVLMNQSTSLEEKQHFAEEILKSKQYKLVHPLSDSQFNYFNKWFYVVVRELATLPSFKPDPEWIAKQIKPEISVADAKHALDELFKLGFFVKNEKGEFIANESWLSTADEVASTAIINYHREMIKRASESIERFPRDKRDISAQTFAVSLETAKKIKEMIQNFRKEVEIVASKDLEKNTVFQLNFQLFPVAEATSEKDEE